MTPPRLEKSNGGRYWAGRWTDADGRKRARGLGAVAKVSEKAARRRLAELAGRLGAGTVARGKVTLQAWAERFAATRDVADGTAENTAGTVRYLADYFGPACRLGRITPRLARDWRRWLELRTTTRTRDDQGNPARLSPGTVGAHIRTARGLFAAAVAGGVIGSNPFDGVDAPAAPTSTAWREVPMADFERLIGPLDHPWRCLYALCRLAGLRVGLRGGEALDLAWPAVEWGRRVIRVADQKRGRTREVPISPRLYEILRAGFEEAGDREGLVCPVERGTIYDRVGDHFAAAGLERPGKPFHDLRKTVESEWLNDPALAIPAVCAWLGNSPNVAMRHYHRATTEKAMARVQSPT